MDDIDTDLPLRVTLAAYPERNRRDNPLTVRLSCVSVFEASRFCRDYIERNGVSPASWAGGQVFTKDNELIAFIRHDGAVMPPRFPRRK